MHRLFSHVRKLRIGVAGALATCALTAGTMDAALSAVITGPATLVARVPRLPLHDLGLAPRSAQIRVGLALNYRNADQLEALIAATSDPRSPEYGQFLTPQQFAANFEPTAADYHRVASTLTAAGFTLLAAPTGSLVEATAAAPIVERFFGTTLHAVQQTGEPGVRYANAAPAYIPAALRSVTFGVAGLNNLVIAKTANVRAPRRADVALGLPIEGPDTGLSPYALATAYNFPVQHARPGGKGATYDGTGHAAGIAIDSDLLDSDVAGFLSYFNIKRTAPLLRVNVDGGSGGINGDGVETNLDVETISGLAPGAALYIYLMPELSTLDIVDTYAKVAADDKIDVLNSSFGGCELADNLGALSDHIAKQASAEGITFSASSGDYGAQICIGYTDNFLGVSSPASDPHFTSVGGTSLLVNESAAYKAEFAWDGSGGGVSTVFPEPQFQKNIANVTPGGRNVPDISFDADPGTGLSFFYDGLFQGPIGGTSLSSPIFCALVTEFNEISGKRSGLIDKALYAEFAATGYSADFRDITIGNNSYFGPGYTAAKGYDDVTGIGSLIGTPNAK